jgi:hypothetical protein
VLQALRSSRVHCGKAFPDSKPYIGWAGAPFSEYSPAEIGKACATSGSATINTQEQHRLFHVDRLSLPLHN